MRGVLGNGLLRGFVPGSGPFFLRGFDVESGWPMLGAIRLGLWVPGIGFLFRFLFIVLSPFLKRTENGNDRSCIVPHCA